MPVPLPETIVRRRCAALIPYAKNARTHMRTGLTIGPPEDIAMTPKALTPTLGANRENTGQNALFEKGTNLPNTDDKQFRIVLKQRFPVLEALATMTTPTPFIMPERLAQTDPYTQITEVNGSGPFKFVKEKWQPGHRVV